MANFAINFRTGRLETPIIAGNKLGTADNLINLGRQLASGMLDPLTLEMTSGAVSATGTVTVSGGSGTITVTVAGVAFSLTWVGSDAETVARLAAAINSSANVAVYGVVYATVFSNILTLTAPGGTAGNSVTLTATGTGATASGATLTGGTAGTITRFVL